jgi:hypothetical protein
MLSAAGQDDLLRKGLVDYQNGIHHARLRRFPMRSAALSSLMSW